jgi:hypothetical protein
VENNSHVKKGSRVRGSRFWVQRFSGSEVQDSAQPLSEEQPVKLKKKL